MRLVFLGPPGAGKGTQADSISERTGLPHISPGDMFRRAVKEGSDLGRKVKEYMDKGQLVPDNVTISVIRDRIMQRDCAGGFILDGFPRNLRQAEELDDMMAEAGLDLHGVVNFEAPLGILIDRSVGRRVCRACGATYHVKHNPPRVDGICDACGGVLTHRSDDSEETVSRRLTVYTEQTAPLIEFYRRKGILKSINADQLVAAVARDLEAALEEIKRKTG